MDNIIFYKEYSRRLMNILSKVNFMSKRYSRYSSIVNRLIDWELVDKEVF